MAHKITLSVEDAKWETFKKYFLRTHPNQTKNGPSPISDDLWICLRIRLFASGAYEKGFTEVYAEANLPPIDPDIIKLL